jgi:hypothetical protein
MPPRGNFRRALMAIDYATEIIGVGAMTMGAKPWNVLQQLATATIIVFFGQSHRTWHTR